MTVWTLTGKTAAPAYLVVLVVHAQSRIGITMSTANRKGGAAFSIPPRKGGGLLRGFSRNQPIQSASTAHRVDASSPREGSQGRDPPALPPQPLTGITIDSMSGVDADGPEPVRIAVSLVRCDDLPRPAILSSPTLNSLGDSLR